MIGGALIARAAAAGLRFATRWNWRLVLAFAFGIAVWAQIVLWIWPEAPH